MCVGWGRGGRGGRLCHLKGLQRRAAGIVLIDISIGKDSMICD